MRYLTAFSIAFIILSGCSDNNPVNNIFRQYDYSIDQTRRCFCPFSGDSVRLFVKADTIARVISLSDNSDIPYNLWGRYRSIKGLFQLVAQNDTSLFNVIVSYDPVFKYPNSIYISPKPKIVNDSVIIAIIDSFLKMETKKFIPLK